MELPDWRPKTTLQRWVQSTGSPITDSGYSLAVAWKTNRIASDSQPVTHGSTLGSESVVVGLTLSSEPVRNWAGEEPVDDGVATRYQSEHRTVSNWTALSLEESSHALLMLPERAKASDSKHLLRRQHPDERTCAPWIKAMERAHPWPKSYLSKSQWVRTSKTRTRKAVNRGG